MLEEATTLMSSVELNMQGFSALKLEQNETKSKSVDVQLISASDGFSLSGGFHFHSF